MHYSAAWCTFADRAHSPWLATGSVDGADRLQSAHSPALPRTLSVDRVLTREEGSERHMGQQAQQQSEPRKDPKPRRRGRGQECQVKNRLPDRAYVVANPQDNRFGLAKKIEQGWNKVDHRNDKERLTCGRCEENGDVTFEGQVLLWKPLEEHEADLADAQSIVKARDAKAKSRTGIDGNLRDAMGRPAINL